MIPLDASWKKREVKMRQKKLKKESKREIMEPVKRQEEM